MGCVLLAARYQLGPCDVKERSVHDLHAHCRWPVDTTVRAAARTSDGVATYSQETRRLLQEILDRRGTDDLFATCPTIRLVGSDYKPVEDSLVAGRSQG